MKILNIFKLYNNEKIFLFSFKIQNIGQIYVTVIKHRKQ